MTSIIRVHPCGFVVEEKEPTGGLRPQRGLGICQTPLPSTAAVWLRGPKPHSGGWLKAIVIDLRIPLDFLEHDRAPGIVRFAGGSCGQTCLLVECDLDAEVIGCDFSGKKRC